MNIKDKNRFRYVTVYGKTRHVGGRVLTAIFIAYGHNIVNIVLLQL